MGHTKPSTQLAQVTTDRRTHGQTKLSTRLLLTSENTSETRTTFKKEKNSTALSIQCRTEFKEKVIMKKLHYAVSSKNKKIKKNAYDSSGNVNYHTRRHACETTSSGLLQAKPVSS